MILAIDIGNTNIVFACMDHYTVCDSFRLPTHTYAEPETLTSSLRLRLKEKDAYEAVLITSVVPQATAPVRAAVKELTGLDALAHGEELNSDLVVRLDDPTEIGSDLVVGAVAALALEAPPLIVFDMGTATTISVIDADASFRGGGILPGVALSLRALSGGAAQLPSVMLEAPAHCIGTNTVDCMRSGVIYGAAAMVDGMCERIEAELGRSATVIATGGIAPFVLPLCRRKIRYEEHLLLFGLARLYEQHKAKRA